MHTRGMTRSRTATEAGQSASRVEGRGIIQGRRILHIFPGVCARSPRRRVRVFILYAVVVSLCSYAEQDYPEPNIQVATIDDPE